MSCERPVRRHYLEISPLSTIWEGASSPPGQDGGTLFENLTRCYHGVGEQHVVQRAVAFRISRSYVSASHRPTLGAPPCKASTSKHQLRIQISRITSNEPSPRALRQIHEQCTRAFDRAVAPARLEPNFSRPVNAVSHRRCSTSVAHG
jgi:hypothetical protein